MKFIYALLGVIHLLLPAMAFAQVQIVFTDQNHPVVNLPEHVQVIELDANIHRYTA